MVVKKLADGQFEAEFWLFGHKLTKVFHTESEVLCFFENIKSAYVTELVSVAEAIEKYKRTVSVKKSPGSRKWENFIFETLVLHLEKEGVFCRDPVGKVTLSHLESYRIHLLKDRHLSPSTVNRYFSTLKNFFRKLQQWDYVSKNPAKFLKKLPEDPKKKNLFTDNDFQLVMSNLNPQDQMLFLFLKLTGARVSSAVRLKIEDIDHEKQLIRFKTKKGAEAQTKVYEFPIFNELQNLLKKIHSQHPTKKDSDYLFLNYRGLPFNNKYFAKRISKILAKPQIKATTGGKHLSLHSLRHGFATSMHQKGLSLNDVKSLLGHSSIEITQGYLHSNGLDLIEKLNKIA